MITLDKKQFANALGITKFSVGNQKQLDCLSHALIVAGKDGARISTTNLETFTVVDIPGNYKEFAAGFEHKDLDKILKSVKADNFGLEFNEKTRKGVITFDNLKITLKGLENGEFPPIPELSGTPNKVDLRKVEPILSQASTDEARPVLTGILFTDKHVVAASGFVLTSNVVDIPGLKDIENLIVPAAALKQVCRTFKKSPVVDFYVLDKTLWVAFKSGNVTIFTQRIEGNYPDWAAIQPKDTKAEFRINRQAWIDALGRIRFVANKRDGVPVTIIDIEAQIEGEAGNYDTIAAIETDNDEMSAETEAPIKRIFGTRPVKFGVNLEFLLDLLNSHDAETIQVTFNAENNPIVLYGNGLNTIIMPVHLG